MMSRGYDFQDSIHEKIRALKKEEEVSKMPRGNAAGPIGQGPGIRRGMGGGRGRVQKGGFGAGPDGSCVCPNSGTRITHRWGKPCFEDR